MILGDMKHWAQESKFMHPVLVKALEHLRQMDFNGMECGRYAIEDDDMYFNLMQLTTKDQADALAEKHEQYIDIHYLIQGEETIGTVIRGEEHAEVQPYDSEKDFALYDKADGEMQLHLVPGMYAVLFPEDIHRPGLCTAQPVSIRKAVVKIHTSMFQ